MTILTEPDRKLILDFIDKRISQDDLFRGLSFRPESGLQLPLSLLRQALREKDPVAVEMGIMLMYRFGITEEYRAILENLAEEPWHQDHEDIVFALGKIHAPSSVDVLGRTAVTKHPYLEYDEAYALGTKSIYALWRIRTPEAIRKLGELTHDENEILRATARERLADLVERGAPAIQDFAKRQLDAAA